MCTFCDIVRYIVLICKNLGYFSREGSCLVLYFPGNFLCEWYITTRSEDCSECDCTEKIFWVGIGFMAVTIAVTVPVRVGIMWGCAV